MFSFVSKEVPGGVMSSFMALHIISVNIPSTLSSHLLPFCWWLTIVHVSFSDCMYGRIYAAQSSNSVMQIIASGDCNIRSLCVPVISCAQHCFMHIFNFYQEVKGC